MKRTGSVDRRVSSTLDDDAQIHLSDELDSLSSWTWRSNAVLVFDIEIGDWDDSKSNDDLRTQTNAIVGVTDKGGVFCAFVCVGINKTNNLVLDDGPFSLFSRVRDKVGQKGSTKDMIALF